MRIWLSRPHMSGREEDHVSQAFASNFVAPLGPKLDAFEASVSEHLGGGLHCVGLSSGSAALHLALRIAGVGKDDRVWVSSMTFAGGVFPVLYEAATPIFLDLSPKSWTLDADLLEEALETANKTNTLPKALIPTDLYGQSVDLTRIESLAQRYGVTLIVDSAESLGATTTDGRKAGTGGDAAILSFNGNKIITTSGGGMLCSNDAMEVLDDRVATRRAIFERYAAALTRPGVTFMPEAPGTTGSRWLTTLTLDPDQLGLTREDIRLALLEDQIETRPLWKPMHLQPLFAEADYIGRGTDTALFRDGLCLPSGSDLTDAEQAEVIDRITTLLDLGQV